MSDDFQDGNFVVDHLAGDVVEKVIGFSDGDPERPQKLLLRLRQTGWWQFFLSAFIGHWHRLDEESLTDELAVYEDVPAVDYVERFGLLGATIQAVRCARDSSSGTRITVDLDRGTLALSEVDPSDPHSDAQLLWTPRFADHASFTPSRNSTRR